MSNWVSRYTPTLTHLCGVYAEMRGLGVPLGCIPEVEVGSGVAQIDVSLSAKNSNETLN